MATRSIAGREVGPIGMGVMPLSFDDRVSEEQAIRTLCAALDAGVRLLDTAAAYVPSADQPGHNERLLAKGLAAWGGDVDRVVIATKGGHHRASDTDFPKDGRPEAIVADCERSLRALDVEAIDVYQLHWPDPKVPVEESMLGFRQLLDAGKIKAVGLSNVSVAELDAASAVVPIASVQNRFAPDDRASADVVQVCEDRGIAFLPYCPLGGGREARNLGERLPGFAALAQRHGVSPQRVALAWHLAQSPAIIPIPGCRRVETITDSAAAADLELSDDELAELERSLP
jgi:aryl-alcohol dehydrogenase-like predicted oxidoreductase